PNPGFFGQLRLGPDQQIYVSRSRVELVATVNPNTLYAIDTIDVIHYPNRSGRACSYQRNALWLDHQPTMLGLPNFISNYTLPVRPLPSCTFEPGDFADTIADVCDGRTIRFAYALPPDADSVLWNFGDINIANNNTSKALAPVHRYINDGRYLVTLTVFHDNGKDTMLRKNVDVNRGYCDIHLPSAFSPDGDGNNERFGLIHGNNVTRFSMEIYNRWGQRLYSSTDRHAGWDGTSGGMQQPIGIYVWCLRYDTPQAKGVVLRGTVLLTRKW
ncbi:MAG: gliding motility-associated C-terminal domain-containing protein, partial [Bacteroidetes bacterium]|nr:gliding motility-associated C-terminal domain-containing protein [Bacteroidota bacterium]